MPANLENSAVATGLEKLFSFQSQRKAMSKNVQPPAQLHSFHMLARKAQNLSSLGFKEYMNQEFSDVQAGFRKGGGTRDQIANILWIMEKAREFQRSIYFCFIGYIKAFDCMYQNKLENSERDGNTRPPDLPSEKSVCRSRSNS